ncbi:MAG: hypothetical protein NC350_05885 [Corallococcus sp.]|nr:hypothetical protein [Corallococcus sp.]
MQQDTSKWIEILNQKDIDFPMNTYGNFHDTCIVSINFANGMYVDDKKNMHCKGWDKCKLNMLFHSQWNDRSLVLQFTGVRRLNLVGAQDNYSNELLDASVKFYDDLLPHKYQMPTRVIVWADDENFDINKQKPESAVTEPANTYVIANSLRWRLIDK